MKDKDSMIADLHIHSRFSRACSKNITIPELVKWAKIKGLSLLGTSDFTHPTWLGEIRELLVEKNGFYYYQDFPFILSGEISLIYTQGQGRRVHLLLLVPSLDVVDKINSYLDTKGRRDYDGRPIFNISCEEFVREMMKISKDIEVIPAHIWTPWFGIFGSKSGFDSLKEAFGSQIDNIHAIETGMSSDPPMNWKIKELDNLSIVSFSDSHSFWPFRLGREATIFKKTDSYLDIIKQIRENDFIATIETDPGYGIYHYDGHRNCDFSCNFKKTKELGGICPVCKRHLTVGVEYRVEELSETNKEGFKPSGAKPYYKILPLHEVISLVTGNGMQTTKVWKTYNELIEIFEDEFNILLNVEKQEFMSKNIDDKLVDLILKNRQGKIKVKPGYDGVYGKAVTEEKQATLS
ncbi:MAG: endonuclease Q family protein [archaeon]